MSAKSEPTIATPTLVVVSGPPGSGKTRLAHALGQAIPCPVICRDEIKEGMVHAHGDFTPGAGDPLTVRTFSVFFDVLRVLLAAGVTIVAEAAFQDANWRTGLEPVMGLAQLRIVQCTVDEAVARERIERRLATESSRRAHADGELLAAAAGEGRTPASFVRLSIPAPSIVVDTTDGYAPELDKVVAFASRAWPGADAANTSEDFGLGLRRGSAIVREYDPRWAQEFAREETLLRRVLGDLTSGIEHIGSTAVPGLAAKPVLDIAVALADPSTFSEALRQLETWGYEYRGDLGDEGGHVFAKGPESGRTHYLHVQRAGSVQWRNYLAFRDALRNDRAKRDQYAALKKDLARRFPKDRRSYLGGKATFIQETLSRRSSDR